MGALAKTVIFVVLLAMIGIGLTIGYMNGKKTVQAYKQNHFSVMKEITGN